jgi:alkylation response protein AidB-like acyl-CoA dehydrogenase
LGCFGLTESDSGSDAAGTRTVARRVDGGWEITGQQTWISLVNSASVALIFAKTDPSASARGVTCFLVPTDAHAFRSHRIKVKLGLRGSDVGEIALVGVRVGEDAVLGEVGRGMRVALTALDSGRLSVAAGATGICQGPSTRP